jgi:hypothetical protein
MPESILKLYSEASLISSKSPRFHAPQTHLSKPKVQFSKQTFVLKGISIKHGGLPSCPNGRNIGTQFLKNVI